MGRQAEYEKSFYLKLSLNVDECEWRMLERKLMQFIVKLSHQSVVHFMTFFSSPPADCD